MEHFKLNKTARTTCAILCTLFSSSPLTALATDNNNGADQSGQVIKKTIKKKSMIYVGEVAKKAKEVDGVPMDSTYASSYIGKRAIKLTSPITSVQGLLNRKPGIVAASAGPLGVRQHFRFRGFSDGAVTQEFDGIPLNNAFTGYSVSRDNEIPVTLNNISGVKIYDGVNKPSVNGPESLGGTINYLPKNPSKKFYVKAGLGYGSFDTFLWNATLNTGSLYGLQSYFSYNRQTTNGWVANSQAQNSNYYYAGLLPYDHGKGKITIYAVVNRNVANKPRSIAQQLIDQYGYTYSYPTNLRSTLYKDTHLTFVLGDKNIVNRYLATDLKFYIKNNVESELYYHNENFVQSPQYPYLYVNLYPPYSSHGLAFNPKHATYKYEPTVTTTVGFVPHFIITLPHNVITIGAQTFFAKQHDGEFYYNSGNVPQIAGYNDEYDEHDTRVYASPFIQDDISLFNNILHITPGIKYIYSRITTAEDVGYEYPLGENLTASSNTTFVAPSIGINVHPFKPISFYFSWGKNVRVPYAAETYDAIQEVGGNYIVAPIHLSPEYVKDYELGTRVHYEHTQLSIKLYRENETNIFSTIRNPITHESIEINNGNELAQGIELGAKYNFGHLLLGQWQGYANYSLNTRKYEYTTTYDVPGESVDGSNYMNFNVGLNWDWHHLQANLNGRYVGSRRLHNYVTGQVGKLTIPPYFLLDLGMVDTIPLHMGSVKSVNVSLTLDNLLNRHYDAYAYANRDYYGNYFIDAEVGMPRAVFASVSVKF